MLQYTQEGWTTYKSTFWGNPDGKRRYETERYERSNNVEEIVDEGIKISEVNTAV